MRLFPGRYNYLFGRYKRYKTIWSLLTMIASLGRAGGPARGSLRYPFLLRHRYHSCVTVILASFLRHSCVILASFLRQSCVISPGTSGYRAQAQKRSCQWDVQYLFQVRQAFAYDNATVITSPPRSSLFKKKLQLSKSHRFGKSGGCKGRIQEWAPLFIFAVAAPARYLNETLLNTFRNF